MVAISMYRGNLHRVPDAPRRWRIPPQRLHLRRFKSLLSRRTSSLYCFNPNGLSSSNSPINPQDGGEKLPQPDCRGAAAAPSEEIAGILSVSAADLGGDPCVKIEIIGTENAEWKKDLEKKLGVVNEKKHYLVQMLKQILNAEEEMKWRIMMQSSATRSSLSFPAEASFDSGSAGRHAMPRLSVDVSTGTDYGGESESVSNHHSQVHLQQIPCASPSVSLGKSIHGSFQRNLAFQSPRASSHSLPISSMVTGGGSVTGSPRLSSGQQGTSTNAVSGTNL